MKAPTKRQSEVLDFIKSFLKKNKYPPTFREIAYNFGISAKGAYDHVKALEKKSLVSCNSNRSRTIEVITTPLETDEQQVLVPLLGKIAAEVPLFTEKSNKGFILLPNSVVGRGRVFALRVEDNSMINAGIMYGDIAVFNYQTQVENGQIVIAMVDEAVTLKRFYKEKNRVLLRAENPACPPIYTANAYIQGRLVALIRSY